MSNTNRLASLSGISGKRAALVTTIGDVLSDSFTKASFTATCHEFVGNEFALEVSGSNDTSWNHCFDFLRKNLPHDKKYHAYQLAFEYCMPESNCRADVVLLTSTEVLVMEFKDKNEILAADLVQATGYAHSLRCFHDETEKRNLTVRPFMVYTTGQPDGATDVLSILHDGNFTMLFASGEIRQIASVEKRQFGSAEIRQFESIEKSQS